MQGTIEKLPKYLYGKLLSENSLLFWYEMYLFLIFFLFILSRLDHENTSCSINYDNKISRPHPSCWKMCEKLIITVTSKTITLFLGDSKMNWKIFRNLYDLQWNDCNAQYCGQSRYSWKRVIKATCLWRTIEKLNHIKTFF